MKTGILVTSNTGHARRNAPDVNVVSCRRRANLTVQRFPAATIGSISDRAVQTSRWQTLRRTRI